MHNISRYYNIVTEKHNRLLIKNKTGQPNHLGAQQRLSYKPFRPFVAQVIMNRMLWETPFAIADSTSSKLRSLKATNIGSPNSNTFKNVTSIFKSL